MAKPNQAFTAPALFLYLRDWVLANTGVHACEICGSSEYFFFR
jgi:hypothetical protein